MEAAELMRSDQLGDHIQLSTLHRKGAQGRKEDMAEKRIE